jgi:hypothetical protein
MRKWRIKIVNIMLQKYNARVSKLFTKSKYDEISFTVYVFIDVIIL